MGDSPSVEGVAAEARGRRRDRVRLATLAELTGACAIAVAQPVLDVFAANPETFVVRRSTTTQIVGFALAVALAPPIALWALHHAAGAIGVRSRRAVLSLAMGVVTAAAVLQAAGALGAIRYAFGLGAAAVVGVWWWRESVLPRQVAQLLAVSAAVFPALFLFASPVTDVAFPSTAGITSDPPTAQLRDRPSGARSSTPNVVVLVFDALPTASLLDRDGAVDAANYPNFAALAGASTWYRNHATVSASTFTAVPAILSGRYPAADSLPHWTAHPQNLFTWAAPHFALDVHETVTELCPPSLDCLGAPRGPAPSVTPGPARSRVAGAAPRGLGGLLDDAAEVWWSRVRHPNTSAPAVLGSDELGPGDRSGAVEDFVRALGPRPADGRPRLDFLHVTLPHRPWAHLPDGTTYEAPISPEGSGIFEAWFDERAAAGGHLQHVLQLRYTDALLGRVLDRLRALETFDDSLIVVTADHGEAFLPRSSMRIPDTDNVAETMWSPLFVKMPDQHEPVLDERPVASVDIVPTIAAAVGLPLDFHVSGHDLAARDREGGTIDDRARPLLVVSFMRMDTTNGDYTTVDGRVAYDTMLATGRARARAPEDAFAIGPFASLVGRRIDAVPRDDAACRTVRITLGGSGPTAYLSGEIDDGRRLPDGAEVALSIDQRVVALGQIGSEVDPDSFWSVLPRQATLGRDLRLDLVTHRQGAVRRSQLAVRC